MLTRKQEKYIEKNWKELNDDYIAKELGISTRSARNYRIRNKYLSEEEAEEYRKSRRRFIIGGVAILATIGVLWSYDNFFAEKELTFENARKYERVRQPFLNSILKDPETKKELYLEYVDAIIYDPMFSKLRTYYLENIEKYPEHHRNMLRSLDEKIKQLEEVSPFFEQESKYNTIYTPAITRPISLDTGTNSIVYVSRAVFDDVFFETEEDVKLVASHEGMHANLFKKGSNFELPAGVDPGLIKISEKVKEDINEMLCLEGQLLAVNKGNIDPSPRVLNAAYLWFDDLYGSLEKAAAGNTGDSYFAKDILKKLRIKKRS